MTTTATISARNARTIAAALDEFDGLNPAALDAERRIWAQMDLERAERAARPYGAAYRVSVRAWKFWDGLVTRYFDTYRDAVEYVGRVLDADGDAVDYAEIGVHDGTRYASAVVYMDVYGYEARDVYGGGFYYC